MKLVRAAVPAALGLTTHLASCVEERIPPPEPVPLPFVVSDYYSPDGAFGDGEVTGGLDIQRACPDRPAGARGDCYTVTYTPGAKRFAGVIWQYPHNNWGKYPGHQIAPGAKRITFAVKGGKGGESVDFGAGQRNTNNGHDDVFAVPNVPVTTTTAWMRQELSLQSIDYQSSSGVIGAFLFSLAAGDAEQPIVFYIDDIRWE